MHGTRDPFASIAELEEARRLIPAETKLLTVDGAGHELGRNHLALAPQIVEAFLSFGS